MKQTNNFTPRALLQSQTLTEIESVGPNGEQSSIPQFTNEDPSSKIDQLHPELQDDTED